MENASKALIIAGAILLAIMIVALGVTVFNKSRSSVSTEALDSAEISTFNQKWERYDGDQLGSQVKSLVSALISNASTNKDDQIKLPDVKFVTDTVNGHETATAKIEDYISGLSTLRGKITSTATYTVTLNYGSSGLIKEINIQLKPTT